MLSPQSFPYFVMEIVKAWLPSVFYCFAIYYMLKNIRGKK